MTRKRPDQKPPGTSPEGSELGRCWHCGHENRGTYDGYFRRAEFSCEGCGQVWTATLTAKQRWDILHNRNPELKSPGDGPSEE